MDATIDRPGKVKRTHKGSADKIRALHVKYPNMPTAIIAKRAGCTTQNVSDVLSRFLGRNSEQDLRDFQANRAEVYDSLSLKFIESITQKKIEKTSAAQLVTMASILHDKSALLRGQPTGINVTAVWDLVAAMKAQQQ